MRSIPSLDNMAAALSLSDSAGESLGSVLLWTALKPDRGFGVGTGLRELPGCLSVLDGEGGGRVCTFLSCFTLSVAPTFTDLYLLVGLGGGTTVSSPPPPFSPPLSSSVTSLIYSTNSLFTVPLRGLGGFFGGVAPLLSLLSLSPLPFPVLSPPSFTGGFGIVERFALDFPRSRDLGFGGGGGFLMLLPPLDLVMGSELLLEHDPNADDS